MLKYKKFIGKEPTQKKGAPLPMVGGDAFGLDNMSDQPMLS